MKPKMRYSRPYRDALAQPARLGGKACWIRTLSAAFRGACWFALAFGIASAIYFTLRRSSNLRTVWWIPSPIALWADYHGRTRNLAAYAILALPVLFLFEDRRKQLIWMASLGVLGTALEYGQLFIPTRWFEWQDIALRSESTRLNSSHLGISYA